MIEEATVDAFDMLRAHHAENVVIVHQGEPRNVDLQLKVLVEAQTAAVRASGFGEDLHELSKGASICVPAPADMDDRVCRHIVVGA
jgi:hypothetical protein